MLELNGSAKVVQDDDSFAAQSITFNMDTEEITMDAVKVQKKVERFQRILERATRFESGDGESAAR